MHRRALKQAVTASLILMLLIVNPGKSQEQRRIQPAYPIAAGEKMIVIPGQVFSNDAKNFGSRWDIPAGTAAGFYRYSFTLPVGSVLKRMVVQVADADTDPNDYIYISLERWANDPVAAGTSSVIMRTVNTIGIASSSADDISQLTSFPLNHAMLQGWTYWIVIEVNYSSNIDAASIRISNIKIIYEP